ncbi:MAG: hypothetical protein KAT58_06825 [candidate division Zixibacteria bacterium]|nr:hypothetical protein [candidate division Zixibacteria bacterium]
MPSDSHQSFLIRARQEIKRAERYCLFLSLVVVDIGAFIKEIVGRSEMEKIDLDSVCREIKQGIGETVRSCDVVARIDQGRVALLLVETPRAGMEKATERIRSFALDFLRGQLELPVESRISVETASFPEEITRFSRLVASFGEEKQPVH